MTRHVFSTICCFGFSLFVSSLALGTAYAGKDEDQLLLNAAQNLDVMGVEIALRKGANPNAIDGRQNSAVFKTVYAIALRPNKDDPKSIKAAQVEGPERVNEFATP